MHYISTRGYKGKASDGLGFYEAMLDGLAPDGGLYLPNSWPKFLPEKFIGKQYADIALEVMAPFVAPNMPPEILQKCIAKAYQNFDDPSITPLKAFGENHHILELFHGPTLAFKDIALQLLGLLIDEALALSKQDLTVLGATSGDTGPAAIEGLKGRANIRIYMLFPRGRVSEVQRRQMTTTGANNVYPIAVDGTFDDCQKLVKTLFRDASLRQSHNLTAINSLSWARLLPQMVYYFYAWSRLQKPLVFSVPTGNFGDVFAGYMAKKCGLPTQKLIIATNQNDILTKFVHDGTYRTQQAQATQSPSMDISVASNFERYLFEVLGRDSTKLAQAMDTFEATQTLPPLGAEAMQTVRQEFTAYAANEVATASMMKTAHQQGYLPDPHTAVGLHAAAEYQKHHPKSHVVTLATAHPAKFAEAVKAATGETPHLPQRLKHIMRAQEQFVELPADLSELKHYITTMV